MRRILASPVEFVREDGVDKSELLRRFEAEQQPYKLELAEGLPDGEISLYRNDDFEDLCRGPHLQTTAPIRAFKLLSQAGAYWRGDSSRQMLTRIYGTAFFKQADLDEYLRLLEEARKRDHRRIGRELDLFHTVRLRPRRAVLAPARDGDLERADRPLAGAEPRPGLPRGAHADHLLGRRLEALRPLGQVPRQHVLHPEGRASAGRQADELPRAHRGLPGRPAQLPRPADAPGRAGPRAPRRALRARCTACCG